MGRHKRELAEMCVKAVLSVADLERRDVNLDLIKVRWGAGWVDGWVCIGLFVVLVVLADCAGICVGYLQSR